MLLTLGILISVWDWVSAVSNYTMGLFWGSYRFFHWLLRGCPGNLVTIRPPKRPMVQFYSIGSLSKNDSDDNENIKIAIGLDWQNNNFARTSRFFVHFYAVVARLQRETAFFPILSRTCTQDNNYLFLYLNFDTVLQNSTPKKFAHIWKIKRDGISAIKFKAARIHFFGDVFVTVAVVVAKQMYK